MQRAVHYLETSSQSPYYNLAFEEYVLTHRTQGDYLLLWQNENTIVVGQNQNTEAEINRPFVEAHHINVVRRSTRRRRSLSRPGEFELFLYHRRRRQGQYQHGPLHEPVVEALKGLGGCRRRPPAATIFWWRDGRFPARPSGCTETVFCTTGPYFLMLTPDMVAGALQVDPEKFPPRVPSPSAAASAISAAF